MAAIRDALSQVPSKPGFVIAAVVVLGLGGWYLNSTWTQCSALKASRLQLRAAIEAAGAGGMVDLTTALPGAWDEVRIVEGHRLNQGEQPLECPFGWDISRAERAGLIAAGDYTLIGLFSGGRFQRYVEWRRDWARFAGDVKNLPATAARFTVARSGGDAYVLTPAAQ